MINRKEFNNMKTINIAKNIADLRKQKGVTQEQLASALSISSQAVSKWETGTSQPDTLTLPLIADYFGVSLDSLYYGQDTPGDEVYEKAFRKVALHAQMSKESYEDALTLFGHAHHGISRGNVRVSNGRIDSYPIHISNENGLSLVSGKGYGAIVTRAFFENIGRDTADFASPLFSALSDRNALLVAMAIISMSDISHDELREKLGFDDELLRQSLDRLIAANIVVEKKSKHKSVGTTYDIHKMYHTCLCFMLATVEMERDSLNGISCCMGYGDYPITF